MRGYIFDENVPRRLTFAPRLPVTHVTDIGDNPSDSEIWRHATLHALAIVTKDSDFSNRSLISQPPPWVVQLRFGNLRRREFHEFLARIWPEIERLLPEHKLVNVYIDRIEAVR